MGAPVEWLSCFPDEQEVVYSPGTYLRPLGAPITVVGAGVSPIGQPQSGPPRDRHRAHYAVQLSLSIFRVVEATPIPRQDGA